MWHKLAFGHSDCPRCDMFGVGAAVQGASTIGAAAIQSSAINNATDAQAKSAQNALDFQKQQWGQQQANQQPYLDMGRLGMQGLSNGLGLGAGGNEVGTQSLINPTTTTPYTPNMLSAPGNNPAFLTDMQPIGNFSSDGTQTGAFDPSKVDVSNDPGYQFRLDQGLQALQRSQRATGVTGGAQLKAINDYAQGSASQEYQNAYGRALSTSQQNANINQQNYGQNIGAYNANANTHQLNYQNQQDWYKLNSANNQQNLQNQQNTIQANNANSLGAYQTNFNVGQQQQANQYNRLAALSGIGQTAVNQLGASGNQAAQNVAGIQGQLGNAYAAGSAAQGNVWGGALNSLGNLGGQYMQYRGLNSSPQVASNPAAGSSYQDDYYYG
jgi:hypothetical protein